MSTAVSLSKRPQESSQLRFVGPSELPDHIYGFLHLLGILHCSLVKWFWHVNPSSHCWTLLNAFHPCLHMGQIIQCDACRIAHLSKSSPRFIKRLPMPMQEMLQLHASTLLACKELAARS